MQLPRQIVADPGLQGDRPRAWVGELRGAASYIVVELEAAWSPARRFDDLGLLEAKDCIQPHIFEGHPDGHPSPRNSEQRLKTSIKGIADLDRGLYSRMLLLG